VEVELCGHATLASAHTLWETGLLQPDETARFRTASGILTAVRKDDLIELDFPATPPEKVDPPAGLVEALGVRPEYVGKTKFDYMVEVASEEEVRDAAPDITRLRKMAIRGVMVTSAGKTGRFDFVSRFFAPGSGVDEDPVTGSAHCCLGPYWSGRLDRKVMTAYQASARGGIVRVRVDGDRVRLGGHAVTVLRGDLIDRPAG
jgi:PhzF family phenazine biosynthesis protein